VADACGERLSAAENVSGPELESIGCAILALVSGGCAQTKLAEKRLVEGGHLAHAMSQRPSQRSTSCRAYVLGAYARQNPSFAEPASVGNSAAGHQFILGLLSEDDGALARALAGQCQESEGIEGFWSIVRERESIDPLLAAVVEEEIGNEGSLVFLHAEHVVAQWRPLAECLERNAESGRFGELLARLDRLGGLRSAVVERGFSAADGPLYLEILRKCEASSYAGWLTEQLSREGVDVWRSGLSGDSEIIDVACEVSAAGGAVSGGSALQDALVAHASSVVEGGESPPDDLVKRGESLFGQVGSDELRRSLRVRLLNVCAGHEGAFGDGFFDLYGAELRKGIAELQGDPRVWAALTKIMREPDESGARWMVAVAEENPHLLEVSGEGDLAEVRDRLLRKVESGPEDLRDVYASACAAWGLSLDVEEESETDDADNPESGEEAV